MALVNFKFAESTERSLESRQESKEFGVFGEQLATRYLEDQGCIILERNYRKTHKEVDIITLDHDELVFIEVKTRTSDEVFAPELAVDHQKRLNIIRVANKYVLHNQRTEAVRFDIITITGSSEDAKIQHIKNAFNVMDF